MYFFMVVSRFLFLTIFGSESGCLRFSKPNQASGSRSIAKIEFHRSWILYDSRVIFLILSGLGNHFMTFVALASGLTFDDFSW